jgi:membrane protease YdiL (CAAX protease family)
LFVFGVSVFFSWIVSRTGSLLGVTLAHGLTNILLFLVVPTLVDMRWWGWWL